jgi:hypothetical protein
VRESYSAIPYRCKKFGNKFPKADLSFPILSEEPLVYWSGILVPTLLQASSRRVHSPVANIAEGS